MSMDIEIIDSFEAFQIIHIFIQLKTLFHSRFL